eukprot:TRINITY_DN14127_c0_g1_i1.p1 TRINITY_DN14127_c0_g1~~TRINITY_DN14127_c0_g1_i1.p1  ORF type:complete len:323 (+),score=63.14 TRINITY_DN14127_c0_g1_i1:50-970(+)
MTALRMFVLGVVATLVQAAIPPRVFVIGTGDGPDRVRTISKGFEVDMTDGVMKEIATNFVYLGPSLAMDGISAFDRKGGIFYWTTDAATPFIYRLNVTDGTLLAPIDTLGKAVSTLAFSDYSRELIIGDFSPQSESRLIRYSEEDVIIHTYTEKVTPSRGTVGVNTTYINWDFPKSRIEIIDYINGKVLKTVDIDPGCRGISALFFDASSPHEVFAILASETGNNYTTIDLNTGSCTTSIRFDVDPLTASAYDPRTKLIWYGTANSSGIFINTISPISGHQTSKKIVAANGESIAVQELALLFSEE